MLTKTLLIQNWLVAFGIWYKTFVMILDFLFQVEKFDFVELLKTRTNCKSWNPLSTKRMNKALIQSFMFEKKTFAQVCSFHQRTQVLNLFIHVSYKHSTKYKSTLRFKQQQTIKVRLQFSFLILPIYQWAEFHSQCGNKNLLFVVNQTGGKFASILMPFIIMDCVTSAYNIFKIFSSLLLQKVVETWKKENIEVFLTFCFATIFKMQNIFPQIKWTFIDDFISKYLPS